MTTRSVGVAPACRAARSERGHGGRRLKGELVEVVAVHAAGRRSRPGRHVGWRRTRRAEVGPGRRRRMRRRAGEVFALDAAQLFEPGPDRAFGALVLGGDLLHVELVVELAEKLLFLVLRPAAAGTGLARRRAAQLGQALKRQVQRAHGIGLLVRRAGREPLASERVNSVGKALYDLDGAVEFHGWGP